MSDKNRLFACISSSTTRSTCLLISPDYPDFFSLIQGPGLNPLEYSYDNFFFNIKKNSISLLNEYRQKNPKLCYPFSITKLSISMEGLHFDQDKRYVKNCLKELPIAPNKEEDIIIEDRGVSCLLAENGEKYGSLVKAGTSAFSYLCYKNEKEQIIRRKIGGWGIFTGYDGGGYDIGRHAIYRVFDEAEGRREDTAFFEKLKETLRKIDILPLNEIYDLVKFIKKSVLSGSVRDNISSLAKAIVYMSEEEKNPQATEILSEAAGRIVANYVLLLKQNVRDSDEKYNTFPIILSGGLLSNSETICRNVRQGLSINFPKSAIRLSRSKAILGNLELCCEATNVCAEEKSRMLDILSNIKELSCKYSNKIRAII